MTAVMHGRSVLTFAAIDATGRLVEENEPRARHERHGAVEQLLLPVRQAHRTFFAKMTEAEVLEHALGVGCEAGVARAEQARQA